MAASIASLKTPSVAVLSFFQLFLFFFGGIYHLIGNSQCSSLKLAHFFQFKTKGRVKLLQFLLFF